MGLPAKPQQTSASSVATNQVTTFNFKPNILDSTANYTYHIRWSMCTEADSNNLLANGNSEQFRNNTNKIIIAESGVTALYNITDFSLLSRLPGSPVTPQSREDTADMTITEPYGLTLSDKLFIASRTIGINNYLTSSCYFIDLWFKGYNEDGSPNTSLDSLYKCWAVSLLNLESTTTESGTVYKLKFLTHNMFAASDHVNCLPSTVSIEAANVGEFLTQLGIKWTEQNASLYKDKKSRIIYNFQGDFVKLWTFDKSPTTSQSQNSMQIGRSGVATIQLARGQDLNTILNFVLSNTKDGQNFTVGEPSAGSKNPVNAGSLKVNGMSNIVVLHSWVNPVGFDTKINDYIRNITYTLVPFTTGQAIIDQENAVETKQPAQQAQRQQALASSRNFIKHYFWTYTGKNLDISKFELTINHTKQLGVMNQLGYNNYGNFHFGPQLDQSSVGVADNNQTQNGNSGTVAATPSSAGNTLPKDVGINQIKGSSTKNQETGQQNNKASSAKLPPQITLRRNSYLEDVRSVQFDPDPWPISGRALTIPIDQNVTQGRINSPENVNKSDGANNLSPSRSLVGSVLNELQSVLASQKLEIRGDPYWIGFGNMDEKNAIGNGLLGLPDGRENSAWAFGGDFGYVFTMRTGTTYNETTGLMDFDDNTVMWNGFYKVNVVTSHFKAGLFTQTLEAVKDPLTYPPNSSQMTQNTGSEQKATLATVSKVVTTVAEAITKSDT